MNIRKIVPFASISNPLNNLKSLMDVWYDGTTSGNQLLDKSGNGRHATLTSNLVTDGGAEMGSVFINEGAGTVPSVLSNINTDSRPGSSGTRCFRIRWDSVVASGLVRTERLIVREGEQLNIRFWAKRVTSSNVSWAIRQGNGTANMTGGSSTLQNATNFTGQGSQAVGSWGEYFLQVTVPANQGGGASYLYMNVGPGTHEILIDDLSITVTGETNNCFYLPQGNATLMATDTKNNWYSASAGNSGIPLSTRANYSWNAFVKKIYCGGAFRYVFLKNNPSETTHKTLFNKFEDRDFEFTSCPVVLTVGSGKTYANVNSAFIGARAGTFLDRARIDVYDAQSANVYADYTVLSGGGSYQAYIQTNKDYVYINGVGSSRITITGTKAVSSTDTQLIQTELLAVVYNGGIRNLNFVKSNGGYLAHLDASSTNRYFSIVNCRFEEQGGVAVFAYRTANSLPQPAGQLSFNTLAGGMQNGLIVKVSDSELIGMRAYTWQDVSVSSGNGGTMYVDNCILTSVVIYDPVSNPGSSLLETIRLTSSGGGRNTTIYHTNTTRNSTVNEIGAIKSIFLTEL